MGNACYYSLEKILSSCLLSKKLKVNTYNHRHQSILPKGRSFTANSRTKDAVLPKGRSSTQNQEPKLQFTRDGWVR